MEDSKILDLFFERSEQAIRELDQKYGSAVKRTAENILRSRQDVEEVANDTYLGVWNAIPPQRPDPLVSFVCKIARNLAVNRCHANTAQCRCGEYDLVLDELEECIPGSMNVETEVEAKELTEAINRFLRTLRREDRVLFVRRYWYGDSVARIAEMTDSTANRVSVRLFRLREKLHHRLMKEGLLV